MKITPSLKKDTVREIRKGKSRFISIVVLVALAVLFLFGLRMAAPDMKATADAYYDAQNMMDVRIVSTLGITEEDVDVLCAVDGVEAAEGSYGVDAVASGSAAASITIHTMSVSDTMNVFDITDGRAPQSADECIADELVLEDLGLSIGDTISLDTGDGDYEDALSQTEFTVVGVCRTPLYISTSKGTSTLGSGKIIGIVGLLPDAYTLDYYTDLYVTVAGAAEMQTYTDAYEDFIETFEDSIEALANERAAARLEEVRDEAQEELDDGWNEYYEAKEEADEELADAAQELSDARSELDDGWAEYEDGLMEIADAEEALSDAKEELSEALEELENGEAEYADGLSEYEAGLAEYEDGLAAYESSLAEYEEGCAAYEEGLSEYESGYAAYEEGLSEYEAGYAQYEEGLSAYEEGYAQYEEGLTAYEEGYAEYEEGLSEYEAGNAGYETGLLEYEEGYAAYEAGLAEYEEKYAVYEAGLLEYEAACAQLEAAGYTAAQIEALMSETKAELDAAAEELSAAKAVLDETAEELSAAKAVLDTTAQELSAAKAVLDETAEELSAAKMVLDTTAQELSAAKTVLDATAQELSEAKTTLDETAVQLSEAKIQLSDAQTELTDAKTQLDEALFELTDARAELDDGWAEYEDGLSEYEDGILELEDARSELADALEELEDGEAEYADGLSEYEDGRAEADEELSDALKELADAQEVVDEIDECEWYVLDRQTNIGYVGFEQEAERMSRLADVFPLIFFLVAALVCLTTMTRMVEEQRVQIGCLKALGYGKGQIAFKYVFYGLAASLIGGVIGLAIGGTMIPAILLWAWSIMYEVPGCVLVIRIPIMVFSVGLAALSCVAAVLAATLSALRSAPATLMRPRAPKAGRRVWLERITPVWKRFNFSMKVTARNLFRYQKRFWMTVIGIAGCTALVLTGFGLSDSINEIMDLQFGEISLYDATVSVSEAPDEVLTAVLDETEGLADYSGVYLSAVDFETDAYTVSGYMMSAPDASSLSTYLDFHTRKGDEDVPLTDDGVILSEKTATMLEVTIGGSLTVKVDDEAYTVVVTGICENYLYHYIYMTDAYYEQVFGEAPEVNTLMVHYTDETNAQETASEALLKNDTVTSITQVSDNRKILEDQMKAVNACMVVIIGAAAALAFVVLFNLSNINITERSRELATLKVLGFRYPEMNAYVMRESVILTLLGMLAGLFLGKYLHLWLMTTVEIEIAMFGREIRPVSYLYAVVLTIVFSLIANKLAGRKLNRIDMVESLKAVE